VRFYPRRDAKDAEKRKGEEDNEVKNWLMRNFFVAWAPRPCCLLKNTGAAPVPRKCLPYLSSLCVLCVSAVKHFSAEIERVFG
jgi:hypothetical protein